MKLQVNKTYTVLLTGIRLQNQGQRVQVKYIGLKQIGYADHNKGGEKRDGYKYAKTLQLPCQTLVYLAETESERDIGGWAAYYEKGCQEII